ETLAASSTARAPRAQAAAAAPFAIAIRTLGAAVQHGATMLADASSPRLSVEESCPPRRRARDTLPGSGGYGTTPGHSVARIEMVRQEGTSCIPLAACLRGSRLLAGEAI